MQFYFDFACVYVFNKLTQTENKKIILQEAIVEREEKKIKALNN